VRIGIDFGTTRTVVAACDRGNYPVISFDAGDGQSHEFFPSLAAEKDGQLCFGFEALEKRDRPGWTLHRSFKRRLSSPEATPDSRVRIGSAEMDLLGLITAFLRSLHDALVHRSNLPVGAQDEPLTAVIATPANAFSTQRLVTLASFRKAGFDVGSMLNEPSAAGVEYAHRHRNTLNSRREKVLVYDLGGGTFDTSLVDMKGRAHDVITSRGLNHLGGDDFDTALVELVLTQSGLDVQRLSSRSLARLRLHCRDVKEAINANTRKIYVELGRCLDPEELRRAGLAEDRVEVIKADEYENACEPLIARTLELIESAVPEGISPNDLNSEIAGVYVVGGASALPAVARSLRNQYGRRVHRSPYPSAAIAIGLAIAGDVDADYQLTERFQRSLGVFREAEGGRQIQFDRIIGPETELPGSGAPPRQLCRRYRASHNVGHFRFVECGWLDPLGQPSGDIKPFKEILFPFDPKLRGKDLSAIAVRRSPSEGPDIEERYSIDESGAVELTIADLSSGYEQNYRIAG
jgi:molecular chaperone DnaK (HSP70)